MVTAAETAEQATQTGGFLVFLLFIPLLSTIWIWVHIPTFHLLLNRKLTRVYALVDDCIETCHHIPCLASVLQLSSYVYYGWCCRVPAKVACRAL